MSKKIVFHVTSRDKEDKVKKLRKLGNTPGNVFGLSKESEAVTMNTIAFEKLYEQNGDTGLIYININEGKEQPVLIDEVAVNFVNGSVIHATFRRVNLKVAVSAMVPIELIGECEVKQTVINQVKNEVEVEALPADLPEKFEVDISTLTAAGQTITLADLQFDTSKIKLELGEDVDLANETIVVLQAIAEEKEEEETEESSEETTEETASEENAADDTEEKSAE